MHFNAQSNAQDIKAIHPSQVVVNSPEGKRVCDLSSYLMSDKSQITIAGEVNDSMAFHVTQQLRFLSSTELKPIYSFINSPGGSVTSGMSIYDWMNFVPNPIVTVVEGQACSMGAFLLCSGTKGLRMAMPNARIMIHQPLGGFQGQASDIQIHANEILQIKDKLNRIIAENTGQTIEQVEKDTDRDNFMSAQQAKDYGLIDHIITSSNDMKEIVKNYVEAKKKADKAKK